MSTITPASIYQQKLDNKEITPDDNQRPVIDKLDAIFHALIKKHRRKGFFKRKKPVKGLYLWGSVGTGKTFMMDCFYNALPLKKMRLHFHQFMQRVHLDLAEIQGQKNPLIIIAKRIAQTAHVICFDEFLVSNIADAMILGELFKALFDEGVTLITSSNTPPDLLYKDGLQRERFLPAIALIQTHTDVIHLYTSIDYRKRHIQQTGVYYYPDDANAKKQMENCFTHFSQGATPSFESITLCNRTVPIVKRASSVIWFDFEVICGRPRAQPDYLALTQQYHTVLISGLRHIEAKEKDLILSFIYFVDILYDAHCRLIISADIEMGKIYTKGPSIDSFKRTYSRLIEMQSESYVYPGSQLGELTPL